MGVSGTRIDNEGEAELNLAGPHGAFRSTFQVAKVNRPLMSIARICDRGHTVTFCKTHASVLDGKGREICRFVRKGQSRSSIQRVRGITRAHRMSSSGLFKNT